MKKILVLAGLVGLGAVWGEAMSAPTVAVEGGLIAAAPADARGIHVFKGLPYAAPPVGERRWKEPAPLEPWSGVRPTDQFGTSCAQSDMFGGAGTEGVTDTRSEDCLYLNIWTPSQKAQDSLPVFVWMHGGAFVVGSGGEPRAAGGMLATKGIIVVTLNYRMGVFGFFSHPDLTAEVPQHASGNYGLMDQIAALRWIQRNIAKFGGDPTRVAIGGGSAGATSVNILMASPLAKGLFSRVIAQGGSAMSVSEPNDGSPLPREIEERKGVHFARSVGASDLKALRALSAEALVKASGVDWSTWAWNASIDGYVLPSAAIGIFERGEQNDVPLLVGWGANEGAAIGRATFGGDDEPFAPQIEARFGKLAPEVLRLYPADTQAHERASKAAIAGEGFISWPTWTWARTQSRTGKQPVYMYKFEHAPPVPAEYGNGSMIGRPGAFHSCEMAYVFGNFQVFPTWHFSRDDQRIREGVQSYWIGFITSGNPNGTAALPAWPAYNDDSRQRMHISTSEFRPGVDADRARFEALGRLAAAVPGSLSYRGMNVEKWGK